MKMSHILVQNIRPQRSVKNRCTPAKIEEEQQTDSQITKYQHKHSKEIMSPPLAQQLLQEEIMNTCLACTNILTSDSTLCIVCIQSYHLRCIDIQCKQGHVLCLLGKSISK